MKRNIIKSNTIDVSSSDLFGSLMRRWCENRGSGEETWNLRQGEQHPCDIGATKRHVDDVLTLARAELKCKESVGGAQVQRGSAGSNDSLWKIQKHVSVVITCGASIRQ